MVLSTGRYIADGDDPDMDTTVIPTGWFNGVKVMKRS